MICVPITSKTVSEAIYNIKKAENVADIIELRADYLKNPDLKVLLNAT